MYIRKLTYKKEDVDCKLCTEYRGKKHPCPHDVCPFIAERIEAGAVTYWDAVNAMISPQYRFARRLPKLAVEYPGTFFLDDRHGVPEHPAGLRSGPQYACLLRRYVPADFQ